VGVGVKRFHVERDAVDGSVDIKTESIIKDRLAAFGCKL